MWSLWFQKYGQKGRPKWFLLRFGCPCQAMVGCRSLKKTSAVLPFPPVGAKCLVRKRYKIWGGWGCTREGHESLGRRVAFQLVASTDCWESGGVVGVGSPVPAVGGDYSICRRRKMHGHLWGQGDRPGDSLLPKECLCTCCLFCQLPLSLWPSLQHHGMGCWRWERRAGYFADIHQLCWWTQFLTLPEQSVLAHLHELRSWSQLWSVIICKCVHGLSSQAAQFLLLNVCIKCLQDYCNVSLQLVCLMFIILDINSLYNAWGYAGCIFCQLPWLCRAR